MPLFKPLKLYFDENLDFDPILSTDTTIYRLSTNNAVYFISPLTNQLPVLISFLLANGDEIPARGMTYEGQEEVTRYNNESELVTELWNVWQVTLLPQETSSVSVETASPVKVSFIQYELIQNANYLGEFTDLTALQTAYPTGTVGQYANLLSTNTSWEWSVDNSQWEDVGILLNGYTNKITATSEQVTLQIKPSTYSEIDELEVTVTEIVYARLQALEAEAKIPKVKEDLLGNYDQISNPSGDSVVYIEEAGTNDPKYVTVANLLESGRTTFIDTFATASGLTCPDPNDLICTWPNGIADPSVRRGWIANVTATNTVWAWSEIQNQWVDTNQAPADATNSFYNSTNDPITSANNVQDMGTDHGAAIKQNQDDIDVVENKTQKMNANGDIAENINVTAGKDLNSTDLSAVTGLNGLIENIIAEHNRLNSVETQSNTNATDIIARLVKNFSTLTNKPAPVDGDVFVMWDPTAGENRNISYSELKNAIDTSLINDQGWYANIDALRSAIPIGQNGWHATIGDVDTRAVWDEDSGDWIEVASKLYYTVTAGNALEVRVTNNETAISTINIALLSKEDIANKSSDVADLGDPDKYSSWEGIALYVEPIRIRGEEDRTYQQFIQLVGTTNFQTNLNDTELRNGRFVRGITPTIVVQAGTVMVSIDGGSTFKKLAAFEPSSGLYLDFDLTINNVFGDYIDIVFNTTIDKWIITHTNQNLGVLAGPGWSLSVNLMSLSARIDGLEVRVGQLEGGGLSGKSFILARRAATSVIDIDASGVDVLIKVDMNSTDVKKKIDSNDTNIIDVDVDGDIILNEDSEPGYNIKLSGVIEEEGGGDLEVDLFIFDKNNGVPVIGDELLKIELYVENGDEPKGRYAEYDLSNEFIKNNLPSGSGFPAKFAVYYAKRNNEDGNILDVQFTAESKFTGIGVTTDDNTTLADPATKTPSGLKIDQGEANVEFTNLHKDATDRNRVIIATYQSNGQYMANTNIDLSLSINPRLIVLFSGSGADLAEKVQLSIDNGSNYYDVEYRLTNIDLTVNNVTLHVMDLYFTGTKHVATYVDSPIVELDIPYGGRVGQFTIPFDDVPTNVEEDTVQKPVLYKGAPLLAQLIINGDFKDGLTNWIPTNSTNTINSDGNLENTGNGGSNAPFARTSNNPIPSNTVAIYKGRVRVTNSVCDRILVYDGVSEPATINNPVANQWYDISRIRTAGAGTQNIYVQHFYADAATANGSVCECEFVMAIPTDLTTEAEVEKYLDGKYLPFGFNWAGKARTIANLLDNDDDFGAWDLDTGVGVDVTTDEENVPYIKFDTLGTNALAQENLKPNTTYTILSHVLKNTNTNASQVYLAWNGASAWTDNITIDDEVGVFISVATTGNTENGQHGIRLAGGASSGAEYIVRQAIIEGAHPNLDDDTALEIIKQQNKQLVRLNQKVVGGNVEDGAVYSITYDDETGTYLPNTTDPISGNQDMKLAITVGGTNSIRPVLTNLKAKYGTVEKGKHLYTFDYKVNSGTCEITGYYDGASFISLSETLTGSGRFTLFINVQADNTDTFNIYWNGTNTFEVQIDNITVTPIPSDTPIYNLSASEISANIKYYFEGEEDIPFELYEIEGIFVKTVQKNKWNGVWLDGKYYEITTGNLLELSTRTATEKFPIIGGESYYYKSYDLGATINMYVYYWDEQDNFITAVFDADGEIGLTAPSNARFVAISYVTDGGDLASKGSTIQIELGTSATEYERYKEEISHIKGQLLSDVDDTDYQRDARDFNGGVQNKTGWVKSVTLTNSSRYAVTLSELNLANPSAPSVAFDGSLRVGTDIYPSLSENDVITDDVQSFSINVEDNTIWVRILDSKLSTQDSAGVEAYLKANDVEFIYRLAKPIPRLENNEFNNYIPINGPLQVGPKATFEHSSNGVIGKFYAHIANNTKAQQQITIDALRQAKSDLKAQIAETARLQNELRVLENSIGYNPDLLTKNKELVSSINELYTKSAKVVELFSGNVLVSSATTKPASNIALTQDYTQFDRLEIVVNYDEAGADDDEFVEFIKTEGSSQKTITIKGVTLSTTQNRDAKFRLEFDDTTNLTAYYARLITDNPYDNSPSTVIRIVRILGYKYL